MLHPRCHPERHEKDFLPVAVHFRWLARSFVLLLVVLSVAWPSCGWADDTMLYSFSTSDGAPAFFGSLVLGGNVLYGMTGNGGSEQSGTIFKVNTDGSGYTVLHTFTNDGINSDGAYPLGSLTLVGSVLYGMTQAGGVAGANGLVSNGGTLFSINIDGSGFRVLHGFTGSQVAGSNDGATPYGAVVVSGSTIYGMTRFGGTSGGGTIFCLNTDGTGFSLLHNFTGGVSDGTDPQGSLTLGGSKLYGMTDGGGSNGEGTIFSMNTDGSEFALLYSFGSFDSGDADDPSGGNSLTLVGTTLYGMTYYGGDNQDGAIFSINTDGTNYQLIYSFAFTDGASPYGSLTFSGSKLYGMTTGFIRGLGNVFSLNPDGSGFTVIHAFAGGIGDGSAPIGDPVLSTDGATLYGMAEYGGTNSNGVIFSAPAIPGPSNDASLANIALSTGTVAPDFDSGATRYTAYVSDTTNSITVTPTVTDPAATVTVNGVSVPSGTPSAPIGLSTGANFINLIVTAPDGVTTSIYTVTVIQLTNLQNWRLNFLGSNASVGPAADSADYDSNGISNLAKYAFGLDPTIPTANQVPQPILSGGTFGFAFTEPPGIGGIAYSAEWTISLNPPSWQPVPDTGSGTTHIFNVAMGNLPSLFMHLKLSVPLSPIEQLGKDIFFDNTLSDPQGMACATCHSPAAGFTGPNSQVNLSSGPVPGVIAGRFGHRKPQAISYSSFSPSGPFFDGSLQEWVGGNFWDGRAPDNAAQALMPFLDPDEMANTPVGPFPPHAGGFSPLVAQKLSQRPYAALFLQVFGNGAFQSNTASAIYGLATRAIAAYEASAEVVPFSSKYDASVNAVPPSNDYTFSDAEENGRQLFFGKAQCSLCHSSVGFDPVATVTNDRDLFTMFCFSNIGVPKNPNNPYYTETDSTNNPTGYNPLGSAFIDYGMGSNPNPAPGGATFMNSTPGDIAAFRGLFKAPSLRNVDQRPSPDFVKSYMHNGVFKSLAEVVHFYNKRNIAVNASGAEVAFDLRIGPPPGYTPLFPPPEVLDNVQNVVGAPAGGITPSALTPVPAETVAVDSNGQVGNLGLTAEEEADLVSFLQTLTDGFSGSLPGFTPHPP